MAKETAKQQQRNEREQREYEQAQLERAQHLEAVNRKRALAQHVRRKTRETDAIGYAVIQSVEEQRCVHLPWSAGAHARLSAVSRSKGVLQRPGRDADGREVLVDVPSSMVYRGHDFGGAWTVQLDGVPEGGA